MNHYIMKIPNKIPDSIFRKIEREKPSYSYENEYASSFKSVIIYVQNGLIDENDLFKVILKTVFKIQSLGVRKYPLLVFGFGNTKYLQQESKYFDFGYFNDLFNVEKVVKTISRISGNKKVERAVIPELFPKIDNRSLYHGKTGIDKDDLLIIIGRENEVSFNINIEQRRNNKTRKHILFVELKKDNINWYFGNYKPNFIDMKVTNPVMNLCKNASCNLIKMYALNSDKRLIFPRYRSGNIRVSEQEARFAFANEVENQKEFFYAIEVPTTNRYSGFSTKPKIHESNSNEGRSGSIDLSVYKKINDKPYINIEFKSGQPRHASITKDILKLAYEPHEYGIFFHILEHSNGRTVDSLLKKINASFKTLKENLSKEPKILCFTILFIIIILENKKNKKSRYIGCEFNFLKNNKINEEDFNEF